MKVRNDLYVLNLVVVTTFYTPIGVTIPIKTQNLGFYSASSDSLGFGFFFSPFVAIYFFPQVHSRTRSQVNWHMVMLRRTFSGVGSFKKKDKKENLNCSPHRKG